MLRLAVVLWILAGTVLAGTAIMAVLAMPSYAADAMRLIPFLGVGGYLVAIPVAVVIARKMVAPAATA